MTRRADLTALPCPECRARGVVGTARIGNYRTVCKTCNNFSQNVRRVTLNRMRDKYRDEYEETKVRVEVDLYPQVIEEWSNNQCAFE